MISSPTCALNLFFAVRLQCRVMGDVLLVKGD